MEVRCTHRAATEVDHHEGHVDVASRWIDAFHRIGDVDENLVVTLVARQRAPDGRWLHRTRRRWRVVGQEVRSVARALARGFVIRRSIVQEDTNGVARLIARDTGNAEYGVSVLLGRTMNRHMFIHDNTVGSRFMAPHATLVRSPVGPGLLRRQKHHVRHGRAGRGRLGKRATAGRLRCRSAVTIGLCDTMRPDIATSITATSA